MQPWARRYQNGGISSGEGSVSFLAIQHANGTSSYLQFTFEMLLLPCELFQLAATKTEALDECFVDTGIKGAHLGNSNIDLDGLTANSAHANPRKTTSTRALHRLLPINWASFSGNMTFEPMTGAPFRPRWQATASVCAKVSRLQ